MRGASAQAPRRLPLLRTLVVGLSLLAAACGGADDGDDAGPAVGGGPLTIGAIPDQDPEKLQRLYGSLAAHLSDRLGIDVEYQPVTDYAATVRLFKAGDLELVWFGGLTGVQARLEVEGARAILQRGIDARFTSVFIANAASGLAPVDDVSGLSQLAGRRFTFGSESSTSGRLMPQFFLQRAGVGIDDFAGQPGFSGSHDATIALVASGTFEAGVVNEQVWEARTQSGEVDPDQVRAVFRTPPYHDYHWVLHPDAVRRHGDDLVERLVAAFTELDAAGPRGQEILDLFGADRFVETDDGNYREIEEVARQLGLVRR
ncbi:MAG: putative selenate ABC transporter substrate-binding protein [Actinomycetota bacterium]|nr:putative selenate ABC transporter substrate-binding protein [Actinomycetota bacterium]